MSREPTAPPPALAPRLQNRAEEALLRQNRVLERIIAGAGLRDLLEDIVALVEEQLASSHCSILLLDEVGLRLRSGAAPHLPAAYNAAIDGTPIASTAELVSELRSRVPGDQVTLTVERGGQTLELHATLGDRSAVA